MTTHALTSVAGYAHRGLHDVHTGVVENSSSAIKAAIEAGFGIEIDVQMSVDRVPMVFHDEILSRLADQDGRLAFMKAADIERVRYSVGDDKIISLATCLEMVAGRVPLLIEVKSHWHNKPQMEAELARLLNGYEGCFGVMSFDPFVIERLRSSGLEAPVGLVTAHCSPKDWQGLAPEARHRGRVQFERAKQLNVNFMAHHVSDLANPFLAGVIDHAACPLFAWTVDRASQLDTALAQGAVPIFEGAAAALIGKRKALN